MDKLERYLDRVCRGIGGPREMRQHIRQELREHLLDAADRHKAAGLPEDRALEQAIADFGQPDEVRSGLEETHGHRLLGVVIYKALDWKEKTMRAKWLWTTWAHVAVIAVLALEVTWIAFARVILMPKFQKLVQDGAVDATTRSDPTVQWLIGFMNRLAWAGDLLGTGWALLLIVAIWAAFEWQVRSENKAMIRLSALGTAATGLAAVGIVFAGAIVIPLLLGVPHLVQAAHPAAVP